MAAWVKMLTEKKNVMIGLADRWDKGDEIKKGSTFCCDQLYNG